MERTAQMSRSSLILFVMDKITVELTHVSEELWEFTAGSSNDSEIGEPAS